MKKTQFTSPIILILLIITYFIIASQLNLIQSSLLKSRTSMLKIANEIKEIEELDLEWQSNLTSSALLLLSSMNSSGTINAQLSPLNAQIFSLNNVIAINYTKYYEHNGFFKTISGTIIVPYPYQSFVEAESRIRNNCNPLSQNCVDNNLNSPSIRAELTGTIVYLSDSNYPLTFNYNYIFE